jgi:hypothetical protein
MRNKEVNIMNISELITIARENNLPVIVTTLQDYAFNGVPGDTDVSDTIEIMYGWNKLPVCINRNSVVSVRPSISEIDNMDSNEVKKKWDKVLKKFGY